MYNKEITELMSYIEEVSYKLGKKIGDYKIENMGCPHVLPKKLPEGYSAVYVFIYNNEVLKIGKVNENSNARFVYQHYSFNAESTLAKSICMDNEFINMGVNKNNVGEWIKNNLCRINIYIKSNKSATELVESILHYKFRPRYEGNL